MHTVVQQLCLNQKQHYKIPLFRAVIIMATKTPLCWISVSKLWSSPCSSSLIFMRAHSQFICIKRLLCLSDEKIINKFVYYLPTRSLRELFVAFFMQNAFQLHNRRSNNLRVVIATCEFSFWSEKNCSVCSVLSEIYVYKYSECTSTSPLCEREKCLFH